MSGLFSSLELFKAFVRDGVVTSKIIFSLVCLLQVNSILQVSFILQYGQFFGFNICFFFVLLAYCNCKLVIYRGRGFSYFMNIHIRCLNTIISVKDVMKKLQEYVDDINENIQKLESRGPVSKYTLPDENIRGRWDLSILPELANSTLNLNSHPFYVEYSITGYFLLILWLGHFL